MTLDELNAERRAIVERLLADRPTREIAARLRELLAILGTPADPLTERRLMASLICEPLVLAQADEVEDQDFSDPRLRHVLAAIRRLRACGADVGIDEIDHEIQLADMEREQRDAGRVGDKVGFWFLVELVIGNFSPYGADVLLHHDMWWLRELADRRRELRSAA